MVRNLVVLGGNSHPDLTDTICNHLGVPPSKILLSKFAVGETRVEVMDSVRGKDVFIIQSGGGKVNDHLMELLITISACKTASAKRVTAVLPLFPYSRQSDIPYNKTGAPLAKAPTQLNRNGNYTFDSRPTTPLPGQAESAGMKGGPENLHKKLMDMQLRDQQANGDSQGSPVKMPRRSTIESVTSEKSDYFDDNTLTPTVTNGSANGDKPVAKFHKAPPHFEPQRGYKQWVAQAGTLVADLLTCAGADHIITMDLHDPQYQGFFDIPVDNLYGKHLLRKYIQFHIPNYQNAVIVSPDAGGAKRATAIADALGMPFALIHKERRPTQITDRQNATMMLVGDVADRTAILVDDLADTSNTITRAAKLLKKEGANKVIALVTHGVLSGDAIDRINASAIDKVVVTNSVDQEENKKRCQKLEVLEVGNVFAEVSWIAPSRVVIRDIAPRGQSIDNHSRPSEESTTERVSAFYSTIRWLLKMLLDLAGVSGHIAGWQSIEGVTSARTSLRYTNREQFQNGYQRRSVLGLDLPDAISRHVDNSMAIDFHHRFSKADPHPVEKQSKAKYGVAHRDITFPAYHRHDVLFP
ncbi:phosphoribosyl pyrophosphokinase [Aureobasidium pullulans]|nr:phosphoribosyl pyrophosphokinase [Aureobasidium pullulans]